jgi:hypothetical protein
MFERSWYLTLVLEALPQGGFRLIREIFGNMNRKRNLSLSRAYPTVIKHELSGNDNSLQNLKS